MTSINFHVDSPGQSMSWKEQVPNVFVHSVYTVMKLARGYVYDSHATDVTFANTLVNIEILGTSEGGGKLPIFR